MSHLLAPKIIYDPPSLLYSILTQPVKTLIRFLDFLFTLPGSNPQPLSPSLRIVCISDTHCNIKPNIPDGDLHIHAGDLTNLGNPKEIQAQIDWLDSLPHEHKIAIAGNHERFCDPKSRATLPLKDQQDAVNWKSIRYLQHSSTKLKFSNGQDIRVYGAPQTWALKPDDHAFRYPYGSDAWSDTIPRDVDILITHLPPKHHLDLALAPGDEYLLQEVWKVRPPLHVFGHIHAGKTEFVGWLRGGKELARWDGRQRCLEHALSRPDGFIRGIVDPRGWIDVAKVICYGTMGLLWDRVWGGQYPRATRMVLASLIYNNTGHLGNAPQVVEI